MEGRKEWKKEEQKEGKGKRKKGKGRRSTKKAEKGEKRRKKTEKKKNSERIGKEEKENRKRTKSKMEKHKFSPTTSQTRGLRDTKNAAVGKTAAFWLKSRAAISCRHRFTALIYEK